MSRRTSQQSQPPQSPEMDLEVTFRPGGKHILSALLASVKDFSPNPSVNFVFTSRGLSVRFAAHPTDDKAVVSFTLDAPVQEGETVEDEPASPGSSVASEGGAWRRDSSGSVPADGPNLWGAGTGGSSGGGTWDSSRRVSGGNAANNPAGTIGSGFPSAWGQSKWDAPRRASGGSTVSAGGGAGWGAGTRLSGSSTSLAAPSNGLSLNISRPPSAASISSVSSRAGSEVDADTVTPKSIWPHIAHAGVSGWTSPFSTYHLRKPQVAIGLNPRVLLQQLILLDDEDSLTIRADVGEAGVVMLYELYFESSDGGKKCMYEMDAMPRLDRLGPLPRPRYHHICQIASQEFAKIFGALGDTSDKVIISAKKSSITFCSSGAEGTLQVGLAQRPLPNGEPNPRFKVHCHSASLRQTFDSRYLRGFTLATPLSPSVVLYFGTGRTPLRLTFPIVVDMELSSDGTKESMTLASGKTLGPGGFSVSMSPFVGSERAGESSSKRRTVIGVVEYILWPEAERGIGDLRV
ncbi:uncharacterized protein SPPG_07693 [Spizellomyces punctatus DAOM BR117]|uniref:Proliferating cell nuclear antigen PCNA C-terminal domain-containing protein n=1 Tax=Spizellomyces punctatus (strain DAOM BR117) TaxID=645134 RepID=A0A0L0H7I9_SPIPD|nr:uncharacterized protein SPPG_07693 [Spizellomyces punctatus DAOM BR117]KNC96861.1 hypothetical protein SPPG_07693 [Spizellomyces punctatus DAOM BR117]|eukprot:XP_016604901.1 hypothetical protein SPPG_07693 [Spizellomyces punctatus DAOM BR117]